VVKFRLKGISGPDEDGHYTCLECGVTFSSKSNANRHMARKHVPQPKAQCTFQDCDTMLDNEIKLQQHIKGRHGINLTAKMMKETRYMEQE